MEPEKRFGGGGCVVCHSSTVERVATMRGMPLQCNVQWATRAEALNASRGDIDLGFCKSCGHLFNLAFEPERVEYTGAYENSLHFSGRFREYVDALIERLISRYDVRGKDVIEVGCGKGEFLEALCERGGNRGLGFDSSYVERDGGADGQRHIRVVRQGFGAATGEEADLLCCRHVLEHVWPPQALLKPMARALRARAGAVGYLEVPNALWMLRDGAVWDVIYEHCSYFTPGSLVRALTDAGLEIRDLYEAFEGQYLCAEVTDDRTPHNPPRMRGEEPRELTELVTGFGRRQGEEVGRWRRQLDAWNRAGRRAVVWGGGSKGVTFLNAVGVQQEVEYVVDVNPRKQGLFVTGTGQQVVSPEALGAYSPGVVLVMNKVYEDEIRAKLDALAVGASVVTV